MKRSKLIEKCRSARKLLTPPFLSNKTKGKSIFSKKRKRSRPVNRDDSCKNVKNDDDKIGKSNSHRVTVDNCSVVEYTGTTNEEETLLSRSNGSNVSNFSTVSTTASSSSRTLKNSYYGRKEKKLNYSSLLSVGPTLEEDESVALSNVSQAFRFPQEKMQIGADEKEENVLSIDRTAVRLDGLEVYAMVSALTVATSVSTVGIHFQGESAHRGEGLEGISRLVYLVIESVYLSSATCGMVAGLHSTAIFALMTLYGRTAVGVGNDAAFLVFFAETASLRSRSFHTFRLSLYSLLVQFFLTILNHLPAGCMFIGIILMICATYFVYSDSQLIIDVASRRLFAPMKQQQTGKNPVPKRGISRKHSIITSYEVQDQ